MDPSVNPCEDFYQFACGNYLRKYTVPDDHYHRSTLQTMQEEIYVILKKLIEKPQTSNDTEAIIKVKKLYSSCMNTSNIEDGSVSILLQLLTEWGVGEWPILDRSWNKSAVDLEWRLAMLHVHQVQPFFHTYVLPDDRNSSVYLFHLSSGSPMLNTQYYLNTTDPDYVRYLMSYRTLMSETVRLLGAEEEIVKRDLEDLIQFETEFANISQEEAYDTSNDTNPLDDDLVFNKVNLTQMEEMIPEIKWSILVDYVFDYSGLSAEHVELNLVVHCEKYLRHLMILLNNTSPRTIANYLTWRFVAKYLPYLDIHFRRLYYDFRREVPNLSDERTYFARWKECVNLVADGFGMALASIYVKDEYQESLEKEIRVLVTSLKRAFSEALEHQTWLDSDTKSSCKEKVMAMGMKIGFPQYILDPKQLDTDYSGLDISEEHFLDNILKMNRYEVLKELTKLTRPVDKERDWLVQPLVVNAFYEATGNSIIFPAGILRTPIFNPNRPKYLNYGMLGVVIGHEITHGFDTSGRKFDKEGNLTQWWSDEIIDKFKEKASCFAEQYSQYPIEMVGQNINGNQTVDDNICDNAGLQNSHQAYRNYVSQNGEEPQLPGVPYTNQQIFFLQYAQIWCEVLSKEGSERANVPLLNSPYFSEAFSCPVGSSMNPVKKCRLWG